jgi:hypothetical protein
MRPSPSRTWIVYASVSEVTDDTTATDSTAGAGGYATTGEFSSRLLSVLIEQIFERGERCRGSNLVRYQCAGEKMIRGDDRHSFCFIRAPVHVPYMIFVPGTIVLSFDVKGNQFGT